MKTKLIFTILVAIASISLADDTAVRAHKESLKAEIAANNQQITQLGLQISNLGGDLNKARPLKDQRDALEKVNRAKQEELNSIK